MKIFEQIYNAANKLREMSIEGLDRTFSLIDKEFKNGDGNNIIKRGRYFANQISNGYDTFKSTTGQEIDQNDFLIEAFKYAKNKSNNDISMLNHYKNLFYYFFLGMGKIFKIDPAYKVIPKKDFSAGSDGKYKKVEVSDRVALDLMLTDYFDDSTHLVTTTEKENQILLRNLRMLKAGKIKF